MAFNGVKYIKNLTKSFGYAVVDVAGELSPAIKSFTESNEELGKELYEIATDWKGSVKKMKTNIMENDIYEFAKAYKNNLFDDLKNGTFYNKDRIDKYTNQLSGESEESLKAEFADMFGEDLDDDWDDFDSMKSDVFMAGQIDDVGSKIAESNAEVTIRSAEYIVKGTKESTKILYQQNNKLMEQAMKGMAAINSNIGQLSGLPNLVQIQANNSSKFFETTTGQLNRVVELLEHIAKNTEVDSGPQSSKSNGAITFSDIVDSKGMPDLKKYFANVKGNIKRIADDNGAGMLGNMFGGGNVLMSYAASPLQYAAKSMVEKLIPKIVSSSVDQFNDTLQGFFGSIISKINRGADSDNEISNWVSKILGIDMTMKTTIDPSKFNKGKVAWDGVARKTLVEVIPSQLAKIVSALTGETPKILDPDTGRMTPVAGIKKNVDAKLQRSANFAGMDLRYELNEAMKDSKISFSTYSDKKSWDDDVDTLLRYALLNGGLDGKNIRRDGLIDMDITNTALMEKLIKNISKKSSGRAALLNLNKNILNERDSITRSNKYKEDKGSIESILQSGLFDEFLKNEESYENKRLREAGMDTVSSLGGVQSFAKQIDNNGNNVFYYLQEILKREDKMYEYQGIMLENWGAGGSGSGMSIVGSRKSSGIEFDKRLSDININKTDIMKTAEYRIKQFKKSKDDSYNRSRDRFIASNPDYAEYDDYDKIQFNIDKANMIKEFSKDRDPKNFIDKLLSQKTMGGKFGVIQAKVQSFVNQPLEAFGKMLGTADEKMYDLIYGDGDLELEKKGLIGVFKESIQNTFASMNDWIDEKILSPIKAKLDLQEPGDLGRRIFGALGLDYDGYKEKMKEGVFGVKDAKTGIRSGGLLGDYVQNVKDSAKSAWNWTKNGVKDVAGSFGGGHLFDKYKSSKVDIGQYFKGGMVNKTGIAAVSEGEIIIPSELNPYYHGKTDKAKQMRDEANAVDRFFGGYSKGGNVRKKSSTKMAIDSAIEDCDTEIYESGVDIDSIKGYLGSLTKKAPKQADKKVEFFTKHIKSFIKKKVDAKRKELIGQDREIIGEDKERGYYQLNDGTRRKKEKGEWISKDSNGKMTLMKASAESYVGDVFEEVANAAKSVYGALASDSRKGSKGPSDNAFNMIIDDVKGNFKDYSGAITVGGGIGAAASLLTGMVGGPLVGAAVGSAVGLTMKSNKIQEWLFGKDVTDNDGNQSHVDGALSAKTTKFIKEQLPELSKFGLVGGAIGTITGHPLLGTMIGAGIGYAKKSEKFSNLMFDGEDGENKGLLHMTQKEFNEKMQKKLPKIGAGALIGGLIGPLPGGILANVMLGSAIGFVSDTDKFKDAIFGKADKDGNRSGGLLGDIKNLIVSPFEKFMKESISDIKEWFKNDVADPISKSIEPITHHLGTLGKRFGKWVASKFKNKVKNSTLGRRFIRRVVEPTRAAVGRVAKGAINIAKKPFNALAGLSTIMAEKGRASDIMHGYTDDMDIDDVINEWQTNKYLKGMNKAGIGDANSILMYNMQKNIAGWNLDQLKDFKEIAAKAGDVDYSYNDEKQRILNQMYEDTLSNYSIRQKDKSKLVRMAEKGDLNENNIDKYLANIKATSGNRFSYEDLRKLKASLLKGSSDLDDLERKYYVKDDEGDTLFEKDNKKNFENIFKDAGISDLVTNLLKDPLARDRFVETLNNTIDKRELEAQKREVDENGNEIESVATKKLDEHQQQRHDKTISLIKQAINLLAKLADVDEPFEGEGYSKDIKTPKPKDAAPDLSLVGANHGDNNDSEAEVSDQEIADPVTAAFGGKIRKSGYAALSKGELIIPKKFAKKFYGNFALGGMIGGPQKFINTPDGRYIFDAESNEYEAADQETRAFEARKVDYQNAVISIPGKIDSLSYALGGGNSEQKKEEDQSSGILSSIVDALGLKDSAIGQIVSKVIGFGGKGLRSLIGPMLASLVTVSFFRGDFDQVLSDVGKNIVEGIFGLTDAESKETLDMNLSQEGKDGEAGASDIVAKGALRSFLKGGKGLSKTTKFLSKHGFGITKRFFKGANKVTGGTQNLYNKAVNGIISKITGKSVEELSDITLGSAAKSNKFVSGISDILSSGKSKIGEIKNAFKGVGKKAAKEGAEEAAETAVKKSLKETVKESGKKSVTKLLNAIKKKLPAGVQKILPSMADDIAEEAAEQASKKAAKEGAQNVVQMIPIVGQVLTVAFAVVDFTDGYSKASSILGIENPTEGECVIAGLINALLGLVFPISLIPVKTLVTIVADKVLPAMGADNTEFLKKRESFANKVSEYNSKNGTDYSVEQYNSTVRNEKTMYGTSFSSIRAMFDKTYRNKLKNGLDDNGKVISGYIDTNTARWKYWKSKINQGLDSEYAEILYINECLHDSQLGLSNERIAEYKERIAAYQSTAGAKEVPTITNDLYGLISTGSVSSKVGAAAKSALFGSALSSFGGLFKSNADYGNGVSSDSYTDEYTTNSGGAGHSLDDYSGNYATGGVVNKTGFAALSKGELVTNSPKDAISAIFGKLFGSSSSTDMAKEYEESTDMESFMSDLASFDPEKDSWKDFWAKTDSDGNALSKLLKRIVASMVAPTFALSKSMAMVSGVLGVGIGASDSSSSGSNSSASKILSTSNKNGGWLSTVTNTVKSAFSKSKDAVSKFISNIGNGIKSLFGGASGMPVSGAENYDSADGSFISQMSSKYKNFMYGDSTFSEEGCAPATAAMFLNNAGVTQSAEQAAKFALSKGYKVKGDGTKDQYFKDYFNSNGIGTASANSSSDIYKSLSSGKPVVLLGQDSGNTSKKNSPFGKDPHYVLATGLDSNGNIIVNDPEATRGGIKYKRSILDKVKSGITTKIAGGRSGIARYGGGDVASQVWYFLRQNGFTEQAAAGVMGNLKQETNMNPACEVKNTTCGIACWDFQNGKSALKEAAKKAGVDWTDLGFQLNYLLKGLPDAFKYYTGKQPHYYDSGEWCWWPTKMTFDEFKALTSINDAAEIFERVYERASKPMIANRQKYANEYYKQFTGKEGEPVSYTGGDYTNASSDSSDPYSFDSIGDAISSNFNDILKSIYGFSINNGSNELSGNNSSSATVTTSDGATISDSTTIGADVAADAANYIGNKYVWGGNNLDTGVDCSGFVQQLYKKHGFNIPMRRAVDMFNDSNTGTTIKGGSYNDLKPGDAMYFSNNGQASGVHHTGIYVGNGHMIHAQGKDTGIVDTDLSKSSYYQGQYIGAKRFGSGSGLVDPNRVLTAQKLFGGASGTGRTINSNNAVQMRRFSEQQGKLSADIENASRNANSGKVNSESFSELMKVLKQIADNTSSIAMICDLIKKIAGIDKEGSKNTITQTSTVSGKKNQDFTANENDITDIVSTLMSLAQA